MLLCNEINRTFKMAASVIGVTRCFFDMLLSNKKHRMSKMASNARFTLLACRTSNRGKGIQSKECSRRGTRCISVTNNERKLEISLPYLSAARLRSVRLTIMSSQCLCSVRLTEDMKDDSSCCCTSLQRWVQINRRQCHIRCEEDANTDNILKPTWECAHH